MLKTENFKNLNTIYDFLDMQNGREMMLFKLLNNSTNWNITKPTLRFYQYKITQFWNDIQLEMSHYFYSAFCLNKHIKNDF